MPLFRRDPFPNAIHRTTIFIRDFFEDSGETYTIFRRPAQQLRSGMPLIIVSLCTTHTPVCTRIGRIMAAEPGYLTFRVHAEPHQLYRLRVPADWVQLSLWERIRYGHRIRTPKAFITPADEVQSEADVPVAPVSHAISRLRPSISMFELNVQPPQED